MADNSIDYIENEENLEFNKILEIAKNNWKWIILSIILCLCCGTLFLILKSPTYTIQSKLLIKDDKNESAKSMMLANIPKLGLSGNSKSSIGNELEIFKSNTTCIQAVKNLKLYTEYRMYNPLKNQLIYDIQPINVDLDPLSLAKMDESDAPKPIRLSIEIENGKYIINGYSYDEEKNKIHFHTSFTNMPFSFKTQFGTLLFTRNHNPKALKLTKKEDIVIYAPKLVGMQYAKSIEMEPTSKTSSINDITIQDKEFHRAYAFIKELTKVYNTQFNEDKNEIASKTEEFINKRLEVINKELSDTEDEFEKYKHLNNITDPKLDATQTLEQISSYSAKLLEINTQIELQNYLQQYVLDPNNQYNIIPSNVGLKDEASATLIEQYNKTVLDRNRLLRSASEIAPQVQILTSSIDELQKSIKEALTQAYHTSIITKQNIEEQYIKYQSRVSNAPTQERILTQIGRQKEIKAGVYLLLLQKREENLMDLSIIEPKGKLIDQPVKLDTQTPNASIVMIAAFIIGLGLPLLFFYIKQIMSKTITDYDDLKQLTKLPIIAEIQQIEQSANKKSDTVIVENINEQYRTLRTNIQFRLKDKQKTILITSPTQNEGKTFNAVNIAVSFALLDRKILLLDLNLRNPMLRKVFNVDEKQGGIISLLSQQYLTEEKIKQNIRTWDNNTNLDLLVVEKSPKNPGELLANKNLNYIMDILKNSYDYIVIDTTSVCDYSDTLHAMLHTDMTIFICRNAITQKSNIAKLNSIAEMGPKVDYSIIFNNVTL